jgi:acyl-CoA thioester hydrolase
MAQDIVFPITEVNCQYKASARFDDWLLINAKLADLSRAKMVFSYEIVRESDHLLLATGTTQNVFTNGSGKIIRLPQETYNRLHALFLAEQ